MDRMSNEYYKDKEVREQIDQVLKKNARMFANLGNTSTPDEVKWAKNKERQRLKRVQHLDPVTVGSMLIED